MRFDIRNASRKKIAVGLLVFSISFSVGNICFTKHQKYKKQSLVKKIDDHRYQSKVGFTTKNPDFFENYTLKQTKKIENVPDNSWQDYKKYNITPECGPVAAMNLIEYWAKQGYSNLSSYNEKNTYLEISELLTKKNKRGTIKSKIDDKLLRYCNNKGYSNFESNFYKSKNYSKNDFWKLIKNEISSNRPIIANIHTFNSLTENHAVVITGFKEYYNLKKNNKMEITRYLIVNDGSKTTKKTTYVRYGDNSISIVTFVPKK